MRHPRERNIRFLAIGEYFLGMVLIIVPTVLELLMILAFTHQIDVLSLLVLFGIALVGLRLLGGERAAIAAEDLFRALELARALWSRQGKGHATRQVSADEASGERTRAPSE